MKYKIIDKKMTYDGTQLRPHFIYEQTGIIGDAIVAFTGPANVKTSNMVDLVDVKNKDIIKSKLMLHFIIERFAVPLKEMIWQQRLFMSICKDLLGFKKAGNILRVGDDIFANDRKLSVSIATASAVSSLVHVGINIDSRGAPVKACGLMDLKVDYSEFMKSVIDVFIKENESAYTALCKVRQV